MAKEDTCLGYLVIHHHKNNPSPVTWHINTQDYAATWTTSLEEAVQDLEDTHKDPNFIYKIAKLVEVEATKNDG